jgi:hypothetical protein
MAAVSLLLIFIYIVTIISTPLLLLLYSFPVAPFFFLTKSKAFLIKVNKTLSIF